MIVYTTMLVIMAVINLGESLPAVVSNAEYFSQNNNRFPMTKDRLSADSGSWFKNCTNDDKSKNFVTIHEIKVTPEQPKKGQDVTISVDFTLKENLSSGEVQVSLNYGNIPIVKETLDLCDLVIQIGKKCPLNKNRIKFKVTKNLPDYVPSGDYTGKMQATDQNGNTILCITLNLKL